LELIVTGVWTISFQCTWLSYLRIGRNGEAYVGNEIETRYAPEANDRFIRVTKDDSTAIYISGEPNDQSFDPKKVPRPAKTLSDVSARIEHAGSNDLLIATLPFATDQQKYVIEVGGSALPIKDVPAQVRSGVALGFNCCAGTRHLGRVFGY
jgi:hypothetical protein